MMIKSIIKTIVFLLLINNVFSQENNEGQLSGNFQADIQYYNPDSLIGAPAVPEKLLMNSYANINYVKGDFSAGIRYEGYLNTLQGYDSRNNGVGIPYRWASYKKGDLHITVGNFYEQFGSGLIFRAYEEKSLGYDNAMEGVGIKYNPYKGVYIKGVIGKQRQFFQEDSKGYSYLRNGNGIVRGVDGEYNLNEISSKLDNSPIRISFGTSFVSKYQKDNDPTYFLPENVAAYAGRVNVGYGKINVSGEYAYKFNDPSDDNKFIYKNGEALLINATYSQKGLGVYLSAKRVDNMSFRSDRAAKLQSLNINYIPAISKNHTYSLFAMYPYASQPNGEMGIQGEVMYKFKKESLLGGKYGTSISVNYSAVNNILRNQINDTIALYQNGTLGYSSNFFELGKEAFFQDINVEITKKISKRFSFILAYMNLVYDYDVLRGVAGHGKVFADVALLDATYKINDSHSVRVELQNLFTEHDMGNWGMGLIEYSISPKWFFAVFDQYNYGNPDSNKQIHYFNAAVGFIKDSNRIQLGYGRQREGVLCVGGVCRNVPASNGLTLSITSSF